MQGPWGALGYVEGFVEIAEQANALGVHIDSVVLPTGSAGTQAGLLVGAKLLSPDTRIVGITVAGSRAMVSEYVRTIVLETKNKTAVHLDAVIMQYFYTPRIVIGNRRSLTGIFEIVEV